MSVSKNKEFLRANQNYSVKCIYFRVHCLGSTPNARMILLFAVQIDFYAEIFVRKE